jgi:hypothetical protein
MSKKGQLALGIAVIGLFVASFAAIAPKAVKAAIATLVRDEDNAARRPFTIACSFQNPPGSNTVSCTTPSIPLGEEVVIETVSIQVTADPGMTAMTSIVSAKASGVFRDYYFSTANIPVTPALSLFRLTQSVRIYADPASIIFFNSQTNAESPVNGVSGLAQFSGYSVSLP